MALVIGVPEGRDFYINDTKIRVTKVVNPTKFEITVLTPAMDYKYVITDGEATLLDKFDWNKDVRISAGLRGSDTLARVVVDAPKEIEVLRGDLYTKSKAAAK